MKERKKMGTSFTLHPMYFLLVDAKKVHLQPLSALLHLALKRVLSFFTISKAWSFKIAWCVTADLH